MSLESEAAEKAALQRALKETPKGALVLAGLAVGLLLIAWLAVYLFLFLSRGLVS